MGEARDEVDGVAPVIESIQDELINELADTSYATVDEIARAVASDPDSPVLEVLERAFEEFVDADHSKNEYDPSLLHYLLTRLGKAGSRVAVEYSLDLIKRRPEETKYLLRYLAQASVQPSEEATILRYASSGHAIYDYQLFEIVRWFL